MDSSSFEGFHAQFDCKLTNGNKNQTQLTLVQYIKFELKNKTEQNRNDKKCSQSGITVITHTNHDGVRATAIMLRSNVANSEIVSEASLRNYIDRPSSEQLRAFSDVLSDALSGEGHISHCNQILRLCHPEQSSCSGEFGCCSFVKLALSSFFTICHVKKIACFCEPQFGRISLNTDFTFRSCPKYFRQKCQIRPARLFKFVNNCRM